MLGIFFAEIFSIFLKTILMFPSCAKTERRLEKQAPYNHSGVTPCFLKYLGSLALEKFAAW